MASAALPCLPEAPAGHGAGPEWQLHIDVDRLSPSSHCRADSPSHVFFEVQCRCGCTRADRLVARAGALPIGVLLDTEPSTPERSEPLPSVPLPGLPKTFVREIDHVPLLLST